MPAPDFTVRSQRPELLDLVGVSFDEFRTCMLELTRVNTLTLAYRPTLRFLSRLLPRVRALGRPLEVLDLGSGSGDMLEHVAEWAERQGVAVSLTGVDLNPWARQLAQERRRARNIQWITADALSYQPPTGVDVIISCQFTHHLTDAAIVELLRWLEAQARVGWLISDLHRHPLPFHAFRHLSRLLGFHALVQHDGLVSIARSFSPEDWRRLLSQAGVPREGVELSWSVPFRLAVARTKPA